MPLISIMVPVYNVERYLPKCLESIIDQTFSDFEAILVNDGQLIIAERFVIAFQFVHFIKWIKIGRFKRKTNRYYCTFRNKSY